MSTSPSIPQGCPFHAERTLPTDGTPLRPSPTLAEWRDEAAATPLRYTDGHDGLIVTRHALARLVLEDPRFSQQPQRLPHRSAPPTPEPLDDAGVESLELAGLLGLDAPQHGRIRKSITSRFSLRSAKGKRETVQRIVARQLDVLLAKGPTAELSEDYAIPIATAVHCDVLGVPEPLVDDFWAAFVRPSTIQVKFDHVRAVLAAKADAPGEDVVSDLLRSELSRAEVEGVLLVLMSSGRDSVAYLIATSLVALLQHPEQLALLREDPSLIGNAIEEFMRVGAMFITLFPRTATEDVELDGVAIRAGQTVSVSPVAANHDERRFDDPDRFDIRRDAFGHLGFGHGQHGCVGQQLARVEIREAVTQLLAAVPELRLVDAEQSRPMPFANDVATYEAGAVHVDWSSTGSGGTSRGGAGGSVCDADARSSLTG